MPNYYHVVYSRKETSYALSYIYIYIYYTQQDVKVLRYQKIILSITHMLAHLFNKVLHKNVDLPFKVFWLQVGHMW